MQTHPLTRDRMRALEGFVAAYGKSLPDDPTAAYWFARVQGKISAFTRAPSWTLRRAGSSPSRDIAYFTPQSPGSAKIAWCSGISRSWISRALA